MSGSNDHPPLDPQTCDKLGHPQWKGGLGGFICKCGEMHLLYHVGPVKRVPRRQPPPIACATPPDAVAITAKGLTRKS